MEHNKHTLLVHISDEDASDGQLWLSIDPQENGPLPSGIVSGKQPKRRTSGCMRQQANPNMQPVVRRRAPAEWQRSTRKEAA